MDPAMVPFSKYEWKQVFVAYPKEAISSEQIGLENTWNDANPGVVEEALKELAWKEDGRSFISVEEKRNVTHNNFQLVRRAEIETEKLEQQLEKQKFSTNRKKRLRVVPTLNWEQYESD